MGTLREDVAAIDDRVMATTKAIQEKDSLNLGDRLVAEFEGIWEALHLIAAKVTELESGNKDDGSNAVTGT